MTDDPHSRTRGRSCRCPDESSDRPAALALSGHLSGLKHLVQLIEGIGWRKRFQHRPTPRQTHHRYPTPGLQIDESHVGPDPPPLAGELGNRAPGQCQVTNKARRIRSESSMRSSLIEPFSSCTPNRRTQRSGAMPTTHADLPPKAAGGSKSILRIAQELWTGKLSRDSDTSISVGLFACQCAPIKSRRLESTKRTT
jgi:hypothetical protein